MKWIAPHGAATSTERYRNAEPTIAGSNPDAAFFNTVLDELLAVIVAADMAPTDENLHQIADAIVYLTERAATSGVTKGSFWFGKTTANFTVPNPTLPEQNYIDFTTLKTYSAKSDLSGWVQTGTFVPPVGIDFTILITSKFWDIPEQDGQQGGEAKYNHTDQVWAYWPKIISFSEILSQVYPVGSLYFGTQSTCPMSALIPGSIWELLPANKAIWTGNGTNANTTIAAGLPAMVGSGDVLGQSDFLLKTGNYSGCIQNRGTASSVSQAGNSSRSTFNHGFSINASLSSSIYGNSSTVQPPAYVANVWRRTA